MKVLNQKLLSEKEDEMLRQCQSAMGCEGAGARWLRKWQPGITEEIEHILQNDLWDSVSYWEQQFMSAIQSYKLTFITFQSHLSPAITFYRKNCLSTNVKMVIVTYLIYLYKANPQLDY
jgi:hypothetical protein